MSDAVVGFVLAQEARQGSYGWVLTGGLNPVPIPLPGGGTAGEMVVADGGVPRAVPYDTSSPWCAVAVLRVDVEGGAIPAGDAFTMTPWDTPSTMEAEPPDAFRFGSERETRWVTKARRHALGTVKNWWDGRFGVQRATYVEFAGALARGAPCYGEGAN